MILRIIFFANILIYSCFVIGREKEQKNMVFPVPFLQSVEGWPVEWNPAFKKKENQEIFFDAKKALANHLQRITYILDSKMVSKLRKLHIRIDLNHSLGNMQYHPNKEWLINNKHDPHLEKRVHVPRAESLLSRDQWAKHP